MLPPQPPSPPPPPPLAGKLDQRLWYARNSPRSTRLENARFHLECRFLLLLLLLLLTAAIRLPILIVVHRSLRLVANVAVTSRARLRAASFARDHGESRRHGERRTRVRCRPTHTDPPIYLLIQFNSMRLSHAYTSLALLFSFSFSFPHSYTTAINTWRRR